VQVVHLSVHADAKGSNKRPRGRSGNVDHFHNEASPEHFMKVTFDRHTLDAAEA
jgi:hypothetical protein